MKERNFRNPLFAKFDFYVPSSVGQEHRNQTLRGLVDRNLAEDPQLCYCWPSQGGSSVLVVLDGVCVYVLLSLLDLKIENKYKQMLSVRLAGDHLFGKWLFTWLLLVMSLMVSAFVLTFVPWKCLG